MNKLTQRKKILFVDDNKDILCLANMMLQGLHVELLLASSGQEAIDIINNNAKSKIDLIFLDLMMPKITGWDVLKFIKDSKIQSPVVVQTGVMYEDDLQKAKKLGAVKCITKPYTKKVIKHLVDQYV
jgi:two-component system, OmpR family, alkaline phosphatase synthesis response regulator PhoP